MKLKFLAVWTAAAAALIFSCVSVVLDSAPLTLGGLIFAAIPPTFAIAGGVLATRQPGNVIGWLMMTIGVGTITTELIGQYLTRSSSPPDLPVLVLVLLIWVSGLAWIFLIYPILHMLLVFPSGKLLTRRWRAAVALEIIMVTFFVVATALPTEIGPIDPNSDSFAWTIDNPIGLLPISVIENLFGAIWSFGLIALAIGGLISIVLRFRRASVAERQQLKWLLYSFSLFAVVYAVTASTRRRHPGGRGSHRHPVRTLDPGDSGLYDRRHSPLPTLRHRPPDPEDSPLPASHRTAWCGLHKLCVRGEKPAGAAGGVASECGRIDTPGGSLIRTGST